MPYPCDSPFLSSPMYVSVTFRFVVVSHVIDNFPEQLCQSYVTDLLEVGLPGHSGRAKLSPEVPRNTLNTIRMGSTFHGGIVAENRGSGRAWCRYATKEIFGIDVNLILNERAKSSL